MVQWLRGEQMPFCLVATKIDKLGSSKRAPALRAIARALDLPETQPFLSYSSETGEGREDLLRWMVQALAAASDN